MQKRGVKLIPYKRRFDCAGFKNCLDERVAEYILFQKSLRGLPRFGYSFPAEELDGFLADKKEILSMETRATKEALSGGFSVKIIRSFGLFVWRGSFNFN